MVDLSQRVMWVPLERWSRAVSRHELGHVHWSPTVVPKLPFDVRLYLAVEDARVNLGLERIALPVVLDEEGFFHVTMLAAQDAKREDGFALCVRGVASVGTSVEEPLRAMFARLPGPLGPRAAAWMERAARVLWSDAAERGSAVADVETAIALARALARELRALGLLDANYLARSTVHVGCDHVHDGEEDPPGRVLRTPPPREWDADGTEQVEPGRLEIETPPLTVALKGKGGLRTWRASVEGSEVRYVHRLLSDGAVFRKRTRLRSGTLLVDHSGSMHLDAGDLDGLLERTPPGTRVATYSGKVDAGTLRIVASGSRRAAAPHLERAGTGNIVDLPALEWLARQPAPRVWISDGAVTGVGDRPSRELRTRCRSVCRRAGIRRVGDLDAAAALLCRRA
jgi:hypothetical protein